MFSLWQIQKMNRQYDATHKTHYAESAMHGRTQCGRDVLDIGYQQLAEDWQVVTCKNCLKKMVVE